MDLSNFGGDSEKIIFFLAASENRRVPNSGRPVQWPLPRTTTENNWNEMRGMARWFVIYFALIFYVCTTFCWMNVFADFGVNIFWMKAFPLAKNIHIE